MPGISPPHPSQCDSRIPHASGLPALTFPVSEPAPTGHSMTSPRNRQFRCSGIVRLPPHFVKNLISASADNAANKMAKPNGTQLNHDG